MFIVPSLEDIRQAILRDVQSLEPSADVSIDSDYYARASSLAAVAEGIYAHRLRRDLVVAHGAQGVAEVARQQLDDHIKGQYAPEIVPAEVGVGRDAFQPQRAVCDRRHVREEDADYLAEAERRDAEIVAAEFETGKRHQQADEGRDESAGDDGDEEGGVHHGEGPHHRFEDVHHLLLRRRQDEDRRHVGADSHEARVGEGDQSGHASQ